MDSHQERERRSGGGGRLGVKTEDKWCGGQWFYLKKINKHKQQNVSLPPIL